VTERPEDEQRDEEQGLPAEDHEPGAPEEPVAESPFAPEEPAVEEPAVEEPPVEEPAVEEPVAEQAPEPVAEPAEEPVAEEHAAPEPVAPEPVAPEPVAPEPAAEQPSAPEPVAEQPSAPEPVAEQPSAPEPVAEQPPAPEPVAEQPADSADGDEDLVIEAVQSPGEDEELVEDDEELELTPRVRPEIPGADLIPDIVSEGDQFLDAEAQAAAEAEAEARAARAREEADEEEVRPIADAAIDLAAGARYTATGKRKTAVARVILKPGTGVYVINGKALEQFFPRETLTRIIRQPLETVGYESRMDVIARMHGGGVAAQAGALRHGISRALLEADPNLRGELKRRGFLTRDPRVKERKKAGLKKARKRPQFSKR
jgi:small subunit ribosomal protein S9